jgi:hypothetical protein
MDGPKLPPSVSGIKILSNKFNRLQIYLFGPEIAFASQDLGAIRHFRMAKRS